ncbi:MAG: toll/interleukin-1 receptor domain-containing protein [Acidobacteriota bacterium]|nr:toll/interleukin-1 receptor domain-containing protein [Acidobacteriota bacterium]
MTRQKIFISYGHIDNESMGQNHEGWVSSLHRALEVRLGQLRGKKPDIWRDNHQLRGNNDLTNTIFDAYKELAVLISIMSPRYFSSEWCVREMNTFIEQAQARGELRYRNKCRLFKVIKTPVSLNLHPEPVRDVLGYEFYAEDPETGRMRELSPWSGSSYEQLYWLRVDDLAQDIAQVLDTVEEQERSAEEEKEPEQPEEPVTTKNGAKTIYLAECTYDVKESRETILRGLHQHGYNVLPDKAIPLHEPELSAELRDMLSQADLAVHMIGRNYGLVPEGVNTSLPHLQARMCRDPALGKIIPQLVWMACHESEDERQLAFMDFLRDELAAGSEADLLEGHLEDFKDLVLDRLQRTMPPEPEDIGEEQPVVSIYIVCEKSDLDDIIPLEDYLFDQGFDVVVQLFDGNPAEVRRDHQENLKNLDAVLVYYGTGEELWLRAKLRELQKIGGYGREKPMKAKGVYVAPPMTPRKGRLRTHEAMVLQGGPAFDPSSLKPFVQKLRGGTGS